MLNKVFMHRFHRPRSRSLSSLVRVRQALAATLLLSAPAATVFAQEASEVGAQDELDLFLGEEDESDGPLFEGELPTVAAPVVDGLRPESTTIYTGEVLRQRGYRTLGEALADIVGVFRHQTLTGAHYGMRGISDGLALEVDGVPQVVDGERDILSVDRGLSLLEVEQVEVVRGPVSAISGAGALTGIVRVKTRRPGLFNVRASATASAIDVGIPPLVENLDLTQGERQVEADAQLRFGRVGVLGAVTYRQGLRRTYRVDAVPLSFVSIGNALLPGAKANRTLSVAPEEALTARAGVSFEDALFGRFFVDLNYANFDENSVSRLSHGVTPSDGDKVGRDRAQIRAFWNASFGPVRAAVAAWAARHVRNEDITLFPAAGIFAAGGSTRIESTAETGGMQLRADYAITENHRLRAVGLFDLTSQDATVDLVSPYTGETDEDFIRYEDVQSTASAALEYQGDLPFGFRLTAGGLVRWRTAYPLAFLPRVALAYSPVPMFSARIAYAEGSQTPDRYDLAALSQAILVGEALQARENALLLPEHSRNLEAGIIFRPSARFSIGADVFGLRHENAIASARDGIAIFPENLEPRHIVGGEVFADVEAVSQLLRVWTSAYGAAVVDGPVLDGNLARLLVAAELTPLEFLRTGVRGRLLYRPEYSGDLLLQRSNAAAGTSAIMDAYITARPLGDALSMQFVVENLFDGRELWDLPETSFANTSVAMPTAGRTIWVRVEGRIQ